jgi:PAS domain S-box-containing protein
MNEKYGDSENSATERALDNEAYRLLISEVRDYAIFLLDPKGFIRSWNAGAKRLKGYTADEIIGRHFSVFYSEEDRRNNRPQTLLETALKDGRVEDEGWRVRKDGSQFWADVVITALYDETGQHFGFAKVTRDLTERKQAEEAVRKQAQELEERVQQRTIELAKSNARLEQANADLREADRMKDQFLAIISHELRTPLTSIYGWVSMLQNRKGGEQQWTKALTVIERNVKAQTQLVDDLLNISRIAAGKLRIVPEWINPVTFIEAAVDSIRPAAAAKDIELILESQDEEPIFADPERLQQVLYNLLTNAIKFTGRGGQIRVEFGRIGSQFQISVADTGEGITPEMIPLIFDRFTQEDGSTTRRHGGLGLGLNIVRSIMELHGGTAIVHSEGKGSGATFIVRLPIPGVRQAHVKHEAPAELSLDRVTILVVEDDADTADMIQTGLESYGATVVVANSSVQALEILKAFRPQLILSDLGMPGMDGFDFMKTVRSTLPGGVPLTPAVALSAFADPKQREKALRSGYQEHIAKPVAVPDLVAVLARFVRGKK